MRALMMLSVLLALAACQSPAQVAAEQPRATLENTYWKLTRLGNASVEVVDNRPEPHIILHPDDHRVSGSSGCNRLIGAYKVEGNQLTFSQTGGTMMACAQGMEQERRFHEALGRVATWRIEGERLELSDASGMVVAELESRYMK